MQTRSFISLVNEAETKAGLPLTGVEDYKYTRQIIRRIRECGFYLDWTLVEKSKVHGDN